MRTLRPFVVLAASLWCTGCAVVNYTYRFDLTNAGALNLTKPGQRDGLEDADVKLGVLVDPTSFQAIAIDVTNKTDLPLQVRWGQISMVAPDQSQIALAPDQKLGDVEPGAKVQARLVPFILPAQGPAAKAYDNTNFALVIPMVVRGFPDERRLLMHVVVTKR